MIRFLKFSVVLLVALVALAVCKPTQVFALSPVRITEIMYDPSGDGSKEFIEFYNGSDTPTTIGGWSMFGVDFVFPGGATLAPGGYTVIARNQAALRAAHPGISISGQYGGKLKGTGEAVRLLDVNGTIISQVAYSFGGAWPSAPSNGGPSLSLVRVTANETQAGCWASSATNGGSPGITNTVQGSNGICSNVDYPSTPAPTATPRSTAANESTGNTAAANKQGASATNKKSNTNVASQNPKTGQVANAKAIESQKIAHLVAVAAQQKALQQTQKWTIIIVCLSLVVIGIVGARLLLRIRRKHDVQRILTKKALDATKHPA